MRWQRCGAVCDQSILAWAAPPATSQASALESGNVFKVDPTTARKCCVTEQLNNTCLMCVASERQKRCPSGWLVAFVWLNVHMPAERAPSSVV